MYLFDRIVGLLPPKVQPYAKSLFPAVATVVAVGLQAANTGELDTDALETAGYGAVLTLLAFLFPNRKP